MQEELKTFAKSILNSYAAIFFSRNLWFGSILLFVTMFYPASGLCGLLCCMLVNGVSLSLSLNRYKIENGLYGFNAVMVGIALGAFFPYNTTLIGMIFALSILVLLLTVAMDGFLQKYNLPYLAFPFLLCLWLVLLVSQQGESITGFDLLMRGNSDLLQIGSFSLDSIANNDAWNVLPEFLILYLKSMSFVFFQNEIFSGLVIAISLFFFSRIAFSFSFLSFLAAFLFYDFFNGEIFQLPFINFGFNFIFTALAVGTCYLVPSKSSFAWVMLLIPAQYLVVYSSTRFLNYFFLPTFSLAFCFVSILFLYLLKMRIIQASPSFPYLMESTPENCVYYHNVNRKRFQYLNYYSISLPFMGTWKISQGHKGQYTHKASWENAWDFVLEDEFHKEYKNSGLSLSDYYCYEKPVIAPADGVIVASVHDVEDNKLGTTNELQNWGNYIILKHLDGLYSLVCHLKKDTCKFEVGQIVKKGDVLALCGNSGLSPYPHLHFQLQSLPYAGAPTLNYPLSYYLNHRDSTSDFVLSDVPALNDSVSSFTIDSQLFSIYNFRLGTQFSATSELYGTEIWEVREEYNSTYFFCRENGSKAWFSVNNNFFCFQRYVGDKNSNLYYFYLSNYKVLFDTVNNWQIQDEFPLTLHSNWIQDILSPFFFYIKLSFSISYKMNESSSSSIELSSCCQKHVFHRASQKQTFSTTCKNSSIEKIKVSAAKKSCEISLKRENFC